MSIQIDNEEQAIFYNKASAKKLAWGPIWFDCTTFGPKLIRAIAEFQLQYGLKPDGLCGPSTYRVKKTERDSLDDDITQSMDRGPSSEHLIYNGEQIPIDWPNVVLWTDLGGLAAKPTAYRSRDAKRDISMFVNHWDVCLSSRSCIKVLNKRGISVQFLIDNDGTIYQTMDMNHVAWHAGGRSWNNSSVGVEISNAYYPKHQSWYMRNGHGQRPIWHADCHGKNMGPFLGFYDVQQEALKALWKAIVAATDVRWNTPTDATGKAWPTVHPEAEIGPYSGIISHFHLKKSKIDCAGLDIPRLMKEAQEE
tara:strand:+ start:730 stop:1653 length:924 start_codon:yes stop_codon:yes gene_type:complete